jgi:putative NIF3 family GTP cyclohydrolase 1 type 2
MGLISSAVTVTATAAAVAAARRHGVIIVHHHAIKTPLIRQGTKFFLDCGDAMIQAMDRAAKMVSKGVR